MKPNESCCIISIVMIFFGLVQTQAQETQPATDVPLRQVVDDAMRVTQYDENWTVMIGDEKSMTPYFGPGTVLLVSHTAYHKLKPGMIVVFLEGHELVGHKLMTLTPEGWTTRGINNRSADPRSMTAEEYRGVIFGILNSKGPDAHGLAYAKQQNLPKVVGKTR